MTLNDLRQHLDWLAANGNPGDAELGRWDLTGTVPVWVPLSFVAGIELHEKKAIMVGP
jgi:hypothetical protein